MHMLIHAHTSLQCRYTNIHKTNWIFTHLHLLLSQCLQLSHNSFIFIQLNKMNRLAKQYKLVHTCIMVFIDKHTGHETHDKINTLTCMPLASRAMKQ